MSNSTYYGPDEPAKDIAYERQFVAGDVVCGTGYGIQLVLFWTCARFLWRRRHSGRQSILLLIYMTVLILIESLFVAVQAQTVQMIYIDNRNYPGGPWAFFLATQNAPVNVIFYLTLVLLTSLADLLVLWRCWVIWCAAGRKVLAWTVVAFPSVLLVASFVMGAFWAFYSSRPDYSMYTQVAVSYGTSYYTLSLGSNVVLSLLIIGRLVAYRRAQMKELSADLFQHYVSLVTIFVESAALYSVFAMLFLFTYAAGNPTSQMWLAVASDTQQIANLLIIYRLADGSAWGVNTLSTRTGTIHFKSEARPVSTAFHISTVPPSRTIASSADPESITDVDGACNNCKEHTSVV